MKKIILQLSRRYIIRAMINAGKDKRAINDTLDTLGLLRLHPMRNTHTPSECCEAATTGLYFRGQHTGTYKRDNDKAGALLIFAIDKYGEEFWDDINRHGYLFKRPLHIFFTNYFKQNP